MIDLTSLLIKPISTFFGRFLERAWPDKVKSNRLAQLKKLLMDERFPEGRSLKELQRKTGTTATECRELLSSIKAEGITLRDGSEGWRLLVFVLVILNAGWIGSHSDTAIAQNPLTMIGRPPVGGSAIGLNMPNGEVRVLQHDHVEGREFDDSIIALVDCGNATTPCYVHWICGESLVYDDGILQSPLRTEIRCPTGSSLVLTDLDVGFLRD